MIFPLFYEKKYALELHFRGDPRAKIKNKIINL